MSQKFQTYWIENIVYASLNWTNKRQQSAFLMLRSKLKQSFRAEGKKQYLKQSTVEGGYTVVPCSDLIND